MAHVHIRGYLLGRPNKLIRFLHCMISHFNKILCFTEQIFLLGQHNKLTRFTHFVLSLFQRTLWQDREDLLGRPNKFVSLLHYVLTNCKKLFCLQN